MMVPAFFPSASLILSSTSFLTPKPASLQGSHRLCAEEFNRAEALQNNKRAGTVGFALTILQRRLASSPEAIYQSLRRRRERLEKRLRELKLLQRGAAVNIMAENVPVFDAEDLEDLEDAPDHEVETVEGEILDQATAARTIDELEAEIATLRRLQAMAQSVRQSGVDRKWQELANLLSEIFNPGGHRQSFG